MDRKNKNSQPNALPNKHSGFSIVWVVPIIALAVAGWLAYRSYSMRGPDIEITFNDGSGLVAGKTEIQYLGVKVGSVENVHLDEKLSQVVVRARLDKSAAGLAVEDSAYWVVRPEIGLGGIRGLDTLLSGPYIGVLPGKSSTVKKSFIGLPEQPPAGPRQPGLNIVLQAEKLGSLTDGDPVYYREFQVGQVDQVYLANDAKSIHAHIHIKSEYAALVHENTRFWNASGIGMSIGLLGAKVQTESLSSILKGGVAFATPPNDEMGAAASEGTVFKLYDDPEDEWTEWAPTISLPKSTPTLVMQDEASSAKSSGASEASYTTPPTTVQPNDNSTVADPAGTDSVETPLQKQDSMPKGPHGKHE